MAKKWKKRLRIARWIEDDELIDIHCVPGQGLSTHPMPFSDDDWEALPRSSCKRRKLRWRDECQRDRGKEKKLSDQAAAAAASRTLERANWNWIVRVLSMKLKSDNANWRHLMGICEGKGRSRKKTGEKWRLAPKRIECRLWRYGLFDHVNWTNFWGVS